MSTRIDGMWGSLPTDWAMGAMGQRRMMVGELACDRFTIRRPLHVSAHDEED